MPSPLRRGRSRASATPKSPRRACPSALRKTLCGLTSRGTIPAAWAWLSAAGARAPRARGGARARQARRALDPQPPAAGRGEQLGDRALRHVLRDDVGGVALLAEVVDGADGRGAAQARQGARLGGDALARGRVGAERRDQRDSDVAVQALVVAEVDALAR